MEKTLYVHVGTPKTGTSAIQQFCVSNEEAFEKRGYCYPLFPYRYNHKAMTRNGHFLAGPVREEDGKRNKQEERRRFREGMEIVKNLFQSYNAIVLSDETLWRATSEWRPKLWEELNRIGDEVGFKVVIIAYLRRQDEYLMSLWSQNVKEGFWIASTKSWEEWSQAKMIEKVIDYKAKMDEYIHAVGRENLVIRKYDRKEFVGGNIYEDFLQTIGLKMEDDFLIPEREKNPGLKGNTNEIRRIINTIPGIKGIDHTFFKDALLEFSTISQKDYPSHIMSESEREELMNRCAEGNREVARLMYGDARELFEKDSHSLPKWKKENPYMIDDVIRLLTVTTIQLREENRLLRERVSRLENRLENEPRNPMRYYPRKLKNKFKSTMEKKDSSTDEK